MEEPLVKIHYWLYPISWIYGMGVRLRNKLFDWGYYRSKSFDVPVVCVGNLAVGGTGKTPHTEYLIKLLQQTGTNVAMLSRGYKRKSKGYVLATEETDVKRIGDEPYQIKTKFPAIRVAVPIWSINTALRRKTPNPRITGKRRTSITGNRNRFACTAGGKAKSAHTARKLMSV